MITKRVRTSMIIVGIGAVFLIVVGGPNAWSQATVPLTPAHLYKKSAPAVSKPYRSMKDECLDDAPDSSETVLVGGIQLKNFQAGQGSAGRLNPKCSYAKIYRDANQMYFVNYLYAKTKYQWAKDLTEQDSFDDRVRILRRADTTTDNPHPRKYEICPAQKTLATCRADIIDALRSDGTCLTTEPLFTNDPVPCLKRLKREYLDAEVQFRREVVKNNSARSNLVDQKGALRLGDVGPGAAQPKTQAIKELHRESQKDFRAVSDPTISQLDGTRKKDSEVYVAGKNVLSKEEIGGREEFRQIKQVNDEQLGSFEYVDPKTKKPAYSNVNSSTVVVNPQLKAMMDKWKDKNSGLTREYAADEHSLQRASQNWGKIAPNQPKPSGPENGLSQLAYRYALENANEGVYLTQKKQIPDLEGDVTIIDDVEDVEKHLLKADPAKYK